jgi:membrane-associated phospholipid phosphatase
MKFIAAHIHRQSWFFAGLAVLICCGLAAVFTIPKNQLFLALHPGRQHLADIFFINYTFLGDGLAALLLVILLLHYNRYLPALRILFSFIVSGLLAQIIKQLAAMPRPQMLLPADESIFTPGVSGFGSASFPSGHTTTAFAVVLLLAVHANQKSNGLLFLLLALLVGYSRIYLGHHYPEDVLAGAVLGTATGLFSCWFIKDVVFTKPEAVLRLRLMS